eukprot:14041556-Alexandrium_andersonii.AAC.1
MRTQALYTSTCHRLCRLRPLARALVQAHENPRVRRHAGASVRKRSRYHERRCRQARAGMRTR